MAYAVIAVVVLLVASFFLHRMHWPRAAWKQAVMATVLAVAWPLSLPMMAFGGVAVTALLRHNPQAERRASVARVAPAA